MSLGHFDVLEYESTVFVYSNCTGYDLLDLVVTVQRNLHSNWNFPAGTIDHYPVDRPDVLAFRTGKRLFWCRGGGCSRG